MKKNGFYVAIVNRTMVTRLTPWVAVVMLAACGERAVVSYSADNSAAASSNSNSNADSAVIAGDPDVDNSTAAEVADITAGYEGIESAENNPDITSTTDGFDETGADASADLPKLKIMAVGDSITHGFAGATSYRKPLLEMLRSSGCRFEMVGSMRRNLPDTGFESPHEAYSGHRTDSFLTGQQSSFGNNQGISESMLQFMPTLVLLNIGTNDMNQERDVDDVVANIDQIIALIFDLEPLAQVVVSTLVPFFRSTDPDDLVNSRLQHLSNALEAWYLQAANPNVYLIDIRDGFTAEMMLPDLIHPGAAGDAFIADKFYQSVVENDLCG